MVNVEQAAKDIARLAALKYFPSEPQAQAGILQDICEMASTNEQIAWLIQRALKLYTEWPSLRELRACFCSRFKPADGVNAYSSVYPDGIPPEKPQPIGIAGPNLLQLPPGHKVSAAADLEAAVQILSRANALANPLSGKATPEEIAAAPEWLRRMEGFELEGDK